MLKSYLTTHQITQAEFARRAGCSEPRISALVAGKGRPSVETAQAIERATDGAIPWTDWFQQGAAE